MEIIEKSIKEIAEKVLPQRPHHLCSSMTLRYRIPSNNDQYEEQQIVGLQYMTFVSDADSGTLYTRAYYDIREEDAPPPKLKTMTPAPEAKKKLSLKDYQNKKNAASSTADLVYPPGVNSTHSKTSTPREMGVTKPLSSLPASLPPKPPIALDQKKHIDHKPPLFDRARELKTSASRDKVEDDRYVLHSLTCKFLILEGRFFLIKSKKGKLIKNLWLNLVPENCPQSLILLVGRVHRQISAKENQNWKIRAL